MPARLAFVPSQKNNTLGGSLQTLQRVRNRWGRTLCPSCKRSLGTGAAEVCKISYFLTNITCHSRNGRLPCEHEANLKTAAAPKFTAPAVSSISVTFGPPSCPGRPALSAFYVNDLPRLNPTIKVETQSASSCQLKFQLDNGKSVGVAAKDMDHPAHLLDRVKRAVTGGEQAGPAS
ncbi:hypothetical protein BJ742DRAFT_874409 [Cladochytrium replicatum]|nr:hypothetical protein BJ742DRAFT_874409 [Cladochytrium replicatum]